MDDVNFIWYFLGADFLNLNVNFVLCMLRLIKGKALRIFTDPHLIRSDAIDLVSWQKW